MATEKTIREKHEYSRLQLEGLLRIRPPRKPAKYRADDSRFDPLSGPDLYCGQKCIKRVSDGGTVKGYLLCRILSWTEREGWWSVRTTIYMVPEESSHPDLDDRIGVLTHGHYSVGKYSYGSDVISFDPTDMPARRAAA